MEEATRGFAGTFASLRNRNLSIYLTGQTVSQFGTFMQATAQSWVVWQVSRSPDALGLTAMLGAIPMLLLGAFAGVWADRLDRRKLLIGTQVAAMWLAFVFGLLLQTNLIQTWHIYVLSFALGCVGALDMPAQSAFIGDLSGLDQIREAVVLNSMVVQVSRMVGPALAGWVMAGLGLAPAFWINGISFLAVIISLLVVRAHQVRKPSDEKSGGEMKEALRFIAREPHTQDILILSACITFFGFAAGQLIPAIVTDVLHAGPEALGTIMGASGAGALAGALIVVPQVLRVRRAGWVIASALIWMGGWLIIALALGSTTAWIVAMFFCSMSTPVVLTTSTGLLQTLAPPAMKARVLSVSMMVTFGVMPFGFLLVGLTGKVFGAPEAILFNAVALIVAAGVTLLLRPELRRWVPAAGVEMEGEVPAEPSPHDKIL